MLALPFGLRSRAEEKNVRAVYLFHRSGDPLEPVLGAVRDFVESPEPTGRGIQQTTRRFGEEAVVGVRGQFVSACVVLHGRGDGIVRRDLVRFIREFEERNENRLGSWEEATTLAGEASLLMTGIMDGQVPSEPAGFDFAVASN
jgi:hypothetical protein